MVDAANRLSSFPFRFPPAKAKGSGKRNKLAAEQVPDQPEIEYLLLRSLANHLDIPSDQSMWCELALTLARELMPEPLQQGAPVKWTPNLSIGLIGEVKRLVVPGDKAKGISYACSILAKNEPWANLLPSDSIGVKKETLRKKYYALRKDAVFFSEANKQCKKLKSEGGWDSYIKGLAALISCQ